MATFLITFLIMALVVAGMAVGVMAKREPIKGSCGGLSQLDGIDCACKNTCDATGEPIRGDKSLAYRA